MNVSLFNTLTLCERILVIQLKANFLASWQNDQAKFELYHWANQFIEVQYYYWEDRWGIVTKWAPCRIDVFVNEAGCVDRLLPYAESFFDAPLPNVTLGY